MGSVFIRDGGLFGVRSQQHWLHILLVLALAATHFVFVSPDARAGSHDITGSAVETPTVEANILFVGDEVQWVWNNAGPVNEVQNITHDHTGGNFTIDYGGAGPTVPIDWNATAAAVKTALEALPTITTVNVTENATGDWDVVFVNPGSQDNPMMTVNTNSLTGGTTLSITEKTKGGNGGTFTLTFDGQTTTSIAWNATAPQVEIALEALSTIGNVSVMGNGNVGDEWKVTFLDPGLEDVSMLTATDSLTKGSTTITENFKGRAVPIDPSGVTLVGANLVISDSEIEEESSVYTGVNLWEMTTAALIVGTGTTHPAYSAEPTGLAYNSVTGRMFVSDDGGRIFDVASGGDGNFGSGNETWTSNLTAFGVPDAEDVAWDPTSSQIFIAGGLNGTVTPVHLGADNMIGGVGPNADTVGSTMDFSSFVGDLEGIAYRAATDTVIFTDVSGAEKIYEITKGGRLIRTININFTQTPADLVIAPASEGAGDSLYVVDRASDNGDPNDPIPPPRDGRLYELSGIFADLRPFVDAGANKAIAISDPLTLTGDTYDDDQTAPQPTVVWSQIAGPPGGTASFGNSNSLSTSVSFDVVGGAADPYVLQLEATDDNGNKSTDTVEVSVFADPPMNQPPSVSAGPDRVITLPSVAALDGTVTDDGLPSPPAAVTTTWTKVSGPGTVTFGNASAVDTTASFSSSGTYVLRLTANDSALQASDDMTVTVNGAPPPPPGGSIVGGVEQSSGIWKLFAGGVQTNSFYFGNPNDFPFYGDWDCDGEETPGLYRQSDGYVYLRNSNTQGIADISFFFGNPGDVPIAGDFDGDGCDTVSIYRPSEAKFYIINELGSADTGLGAADYSFFYGVIGDSPFVGDWTGDGIDTPGLRRNSDGFVYLRNTNTQGVADVSYFYGNSGDVVFTGDWDADGDDTLGLYRPSNGVVYLRNTNSTGIADSQFTIGGGMYPVAGDH